MAPNFGTLGLGLQDLGGVFTIEAGLLAALLAIFTIMLSDFFDTMGTVTGVAPRPASTTRTDRARRGPRPARRRHGSRSRWGRGRSARNDVHRDAAASPTVDDRDDFGRHGLLFLVAIFLTPFVQIIPLQAAAPALVLVGYLMFTQIGEIDAGDVTGFPALLIMILMPLTFTITIGIGAGIWCGWSSGRGQKRGEIHWLMWIVFIAFVLYFARSGSSAGL